MALHRCSECNGLVSDRAAACPHCGISIASALAAAKPAQKVSAECQSGATGNTVHQARASAEDLNTPSAPAQNAFPGVDAPGPSARREIPSSVASLLKQAREGPSPDAPAPERSNPAPDKDRGDRSKQRDNAISAATGAAIVMAIVATYPVALKHKDWNSAVQAFSDRPALLLSPIFYAAMAIGIANRSRVCAGIMTLVAGGAGIYFWSQDGLKAAALPIMTAIVAGCALVAMKEE